jgi:5-(carboxyamino)imidazole ribonucleotide synthase
MTGFPLPPGSTIGIMGGGQLGRMTALAAATLGYRCHIFTPETDSPAEQVSANATVADYTDVAALEAFADNVDVVTFEFENVPFECVQTLAERVPVRPGWNCLRISQDRLVEKDFINGLGIPTTPYRAIHNLDELSATIGELGRPAVLKTTRLGYDGKGQVLIDAETNLDEAWNTIAQAAGGDAAILEAFVDLSMEISVVVARGDDKNWAAFPPVENRHVNHILDVTRAPARLPKEINEIAIRSAVAIADEMDLVGLLAVEMFLTVDSDTGGLGPNSLLLVNEIAPRPHNSGHWTMDACTASQFDQFVRAVAGLPLGPSEPHHDAIMKNLIGDDVEAWRGVVSNPDEVLHLYGKAEIRAGRKMGHVNRLYPRDELPDS